jgi:hypothetical protein
LRKQQTISIPFSSERGANMPADPALVNACVQSFLQSPIMKRINNFLDRQAVINNKSGGTGAKPKLLSEQDISPQELATAATQYALSCQEEGEQVTYEEARAHVLKKLATKGKMPKAVRLARYTAATSPDIAEYSLRQRSAVALERCSSDDAAFRRKERALEIINEATLDGQTIRYERALAMAAEELG